MFVPADDWIAFVKCHEAQLQGFAKAQTGDAVEACDIVQESFLLFFTKYGCPTEFEAKAKRSAKATMYDIVRYKCKDYCRRNARKKRKEMAKAELDGAVVVDGIKPAHLQHCKEKSVPECSAHIDLEWLEEHVVAQLTEKEVLRYRVFFVRGLTGHEAAEALELADGSERHAKSELRDKLERILEREGVSAIAWRQSRKQYKLHQAPHDLGDGHVARNSENIPNTTYNEVSSNE
jgi:DNA-directed RNA polymerase specialized sigma24 family protein